MAGRDRIVVGVDGSESSKAALRWAIRQAGLTGGSVDAVSAWRYPAIYGAAPVMNVDIDFEAAARQTLTNTLAEVSPLEPEVPVNLVVTRGQPADVLLRTAKGASLLVVGSRGLGGFTSALLGSVGMYCVLHADCPVLVLRESGEEDCRAEDDGREEPA